MIAHLWQSTLFAIAAGLMTLVFRRNQARIRFGLWLTASLKFLVPFAPLIALGARIHWQPASPTVAVADVSFAIVRIAQPFSATPSPQPRDWVSPALLGLWACGFATIVILRLRLWRRIRAALRSSIPLDLPAPVEVRACPGLLEPGVVGLFHPVLLIPQNIQARLTPSQLEAVLAHELCHVRRRDNLFAAIHMLVEALFWFHPLVFWIGARMMEERERACDEAVLTPGREPRVYADAIVTICRACVESPLVCVSGVTGGNLKLRIEAIMSDYRAHKLTPAKKVLLTVTAISAIAAPILTGVIARLSILPEIHAQTRPVIPPAPAAPQRTETPVSPHRLLAMLFDLGPMSADDQARTRQTALTFIQTRFQPTDSVAVMTYDHGSLKVAQDFTVNRAALESVISQLSAPPSSSTPQLSAIETAARMLSPLPGADSLIYFTNGAQSLTSMESLTQLGIKLYAIDIRGDVRGVVPVGGDRPPAAAMQQEVAYRRIVNRYGQPDQLENRDSSQILRYQYVNSFHSRVEFEISEGRTRINWPPPSATFDAPSGLPGRHSSMQVYPAGEFQILSVPLDSVSGQVNLLASITIPSGQSVANLSDSQPPAPNPYQASFLLQAGTYTCRLTVKEIATGQTYDEVIHFEVK